MGDTTLKAAIQKSSNMGEFEMKAFIRWVKKRIVVAGICVGCLVLTACGQKATPTEKEVSGDVIETESDAAGEKKVDKTSEDAGQQAQDEESSKQAEKPEPSVEQEKDSGTDAEENGAQNGAYILARPSQNGALSVKGTQLVDEKGNAVQLRGISTHGIAWFPQFVNQEAVNQLSSDFGANLLRIAMYTDENGGYCTDGDKQQLKQLVTDGVAYAKQADMYVIVDWHILHDNNPLQHKDEALQFFQEMTQTLKNESHVLYEICNEPNGGTGWNEVKSYAESVIPVIRQNVPNAVVLVGTPTWCQDIDKAQNNPLTGFDNIMYTVHFYAATHKEDLRGKMTNAINAGIPVFVSEFGMCDASGNGGNDFAQAQSWIDTMDSYGVSYAVWSLCNKNETSALIASDCQKTSGFTTSELSESGNWIYQMLHAKGNSIKPYAGEEQKNSGDQKQDTTQEKKEPQGTDSGGENATGNTDGQTHTYKDLNVQAKVTGQWESDGKTFYQYQLTITNKGKGAVDSWEIPLNFSNEFELSDGWNGEYRVDGNKLVIRAKEYNGTIKAGESVSDIGFIVSAKGQLSL